MSTSKDRKGAIVMKLSHFLRFYQNIKGVSLSPQRAEEEAPKCGVIIDHSGEVECGIKSPPRSDTPFNRAA